MVLGSNVLQVKPDIKSKKLLIHGSTVSLMVESRFDKWLNHDWIGGLVIKSRLD